MMPPVRARSEAAVDALHAEMLRQGHTPGGARELLRTLEPETGVLMGALRRAVPVEVLQALALTAPWSRDPRVLGAVVLSPKSPPRLCLTLLGSLYWLDLAEVCRTLRIAAPVRNRAEALLLERLPDLRLGDRIALARMATAPVLREMLRGEDARVIEGALLNQRLREEDLLSVMRRDDVPVVVLETAARLRRWADHYNVRRVLVLQPRTPLGLALAQITSLVRRDLARVARARGLRPLLKAAALTAAGAETLRDQGDTD